MTARSVLIGVPLQVTVALGCFWLADACAPVDRSYLLDSRQRLGTVREQAARRRAGESEDVFRPESPFAEGWPAARRSPERKVRHTGAPILRRAALNDELKVFDDLARGELL